MGLESLWADVDHAESCLVSAMYDKAVELASSTLRTLRSESWDEVHGRPPGQNELSEEEAECAELVSMVEAAGLVLLQALNQMGRSNLFEDLISIFDSVGNVPYSLILTGTCLQLSVGFHSSAHTALEEYLNVWRSTETSTDGLLVKVTEASLENQEDGKRSTEVNDNKRMPHWFYLPRTDYLQLTEIYAIEVLAKVNKNLGAAEFWIKNSSISEDDKQAILARLQLLSESQKPSLSSSTRQSTMPSSSSERVQRAREEMEKVGSLKNEAVTSLESSLANGVHPIPMASQEPTSKAVVRGSGIWRFPFLRTVVRLAELLMIRLSGSPGSKWALMLSKLPQSNMLRTGAGMSIIIYALLRKRQHVTRWIVQMVQLASVCFSDLWQLAFSVHLNPLAAVQPLPSMRAS